MNKLTDFNDMAKLSGLEAVKLAIDAAKPVASVRQLKRWAASSKRLCH